MGEEAVNLSDSIADALMLKQVATGSLSRADIVEAVDEVLNGYDVRRRPAITDAPIFWPRPWVSKEAVAEE